MAYGFSFLSYRVWCGGWDSNPRTPKGQDAPSEGPPDLESCTFNQASLPPHQPLAPHRTIKNLSANPPSSLPNSPGLQSESCLMHHSVRIAARRRLFDSIEYRRTPRFLPVNQNYLRFRGSLSLEETEVSAGNGSTASEESCSDLSHEATDQSWRREAGITNLHYP